MASIQKRENGSWRARYRDAAGKEHARHFGRKVDAQRWLDEVTASVVTGTYVDPKAGRIAFRDWFADWSSRQVWAPGTTAAASQAAGTVTFADVPMRLIRRSHVEEWVKAMTRATEARPAGLAATTVRMRFAYVNGAFLAAVRDKVIPENPAAGVPLPRVRRAEAAMRIPTPEQVGRALEAAPVGFGAFVAVCAFAGLRLGEASALRLADVDEKAGTITVSRQLQGHSRADVKVVPPKHGSERVVAAPAGLVRLIQRHAEDVGVWGEEQYLFGLGAYLTRSSATKQWATTRTAVGLEAFTLHDLRHFYASGLIAAGCDVVTVQRSLGHAKATTTLNTYAHLWPTAEDRTRKAAESIMSTSLGQAAATFAALGARMGD